MKKLTNLLMLLAVALFAACDNEIIEAPEPLEVKPYNLEGVWKLETLNGNALAEGTYVYVAIDRKYGFEIYQNTASMYPVLETGTYELESDWRVGDVISGVYDYDRGPWSYSYVITDLFEESMTWTAREEPSEVQCFVRVPEVPAAIVEAVRRPLE